MKTKLLLLWLLLCLPCWQLFAQTPPANFSTVSVAAGWDEAVGITFNKSGTQMFVWERPGRVWVVENGQRSLLLDIREEVGGWRDFGLLGFALHPQFDTNGYFYVFYTVDRHHLINFGTSGYSPTTDEYFSATINRLTRYTATKTTTGYSVNSATRKVLLGATKETGIPILHQSHGPGSIVFGTDGSLLVSTGDGASYDSDDVGNASETYYAQALTNGIITPEQNVGSLRAQQLESSNGKVLRIDPETGNGLASNPFYQSTNPASVQSKVWALGLRNPFRMILRPGSGSTIPSDGKPGTLYIGDVGYNTWEELNIATKPGMNFGWPLFEGLTVQDGYWNKKTYNKYAPNPAYGTKGCTQQYFYFQDLIKQQTASGTATFLNPCNGQALPSTVRTYMHSRPVIDWGHQGGPSRTGTFSGETATTINLNDPASPVPGSLFEGGSGIAGAFYTSNAYPPEYRNTCFFGDYVSGFIRVLSVDGIDKPLAVKDFIDNSAVVVSMAAHPTDGSIYYVSFYPSDIRKIVYRAPDRAPIAVASADKTFGTGPLTVQFTGDKSYDPDGRSITYLWNFGDGATSTAANPSHTYSSGSPTNYTVTLTVKDNNLTGQASLIISANNTPPEVTITSPVDGTKYPMDKETVYNLKATVADQQHPNSQLGYQWQTILHHDDHNHPEPIDTRPETTTTITPLGCGTETYSYQITLTVTDPLGLASKKEVWLYPNCSATPPSTTAVYRINAGGPAVEAFAADQYFVASGGGVYTSPNPISGTTNPAIYQSERWGNKEMSYAFPVTNGQYTVVLHFAETVFTAAGKRVFDVALENTPALTMYDIFKKVGANTATSETFPVTVSDGVLNINFTSLNPGNIENPKISAIEVLGSSTTNQPPTANAGPDKSITLPTNSVALAGSGSDPENSISGYRWTQLSGPNTATLSGATTPTVTASGLIAGSYAFRFTVTDNAGATASDEVNVTVNPAPPAPSGTAVHRINTGGLAVGSFAADQYFVPGSGDTYSSPNPISGTSNPAIYQSERWGQGTLTYALPVTNGQYTVVLHFAEIWFTGSGQRVFDVALENTPVLTTYDIVKKVGTNTATTETFPVSVNDGMLTVSLTSLNMGGRDNPKISAIEVFSSSTTANLPPTANAGPDRTITLPTNSLTLAGSGSDPDGTISSYSWTKTGGPAATLSGATTQNLSVSDMVAGSYTFRLTVTDNAGASAFDEVNVTVNPEPTPTPTGPQIASFTLINVTTGKESPLATGGVIDLTTGSNFNIRANPGPATVSRVDFALSGTEQRTISDRSAPFTLISDGKNSVWRPQVGNYTLSATPFATGGNNSAGTASSITFQVANGSTATAQASVATLLGGETSGANLVQYYPNPFTDQFTLQIQAKGTGKQPVKLYDMLGKEVLTLDDVPTGKPISLGRQLPAGVYTLSVGTGTNLKRYRLIKVN